jgi:hypothetical protein
MPKSELVPAVSLLPDTKNNHHSPAQVELFLSKVRFGLPLQTSAILAGIPWSTVAGWLTEDALEESASLLRDAIQKAESERQDELLHELDALGAKAWQSKAWQLERRWRDKYGQRVDSNVDTGPKVAIIIGDLVTAAAAGRPPAIEVIATQVDD